MHDPAGHEKRWREIAPFVWQEVDGRDLLQATFKDGQVDQVGSDAIGPMVLMPAGFAAASWNLWLLIATGAILALLLAARHPRDVHGAALFAPVFRLNGWLIPWYVRLFRAIQHKWAANFIGFPDLEPPGIKDDRIRDVIRNALFSGDSTGAGLPATPGRAVLEHRRLVSVVKRELQSIQQPALIVHPREDERHIRASDVREIAEAFEKEWGPALEYNIEGDPRAGWLEPVARARPAQATLVPVAPGEVTSNAGWVPGKDDAIEQLMTAARPLRGPLAVRSSAADEDGADASFAGQHLTLLNVPSVDDLSKG